MPAVEHHQPVCRPPTGEQRAQTLIREHAFDKVLSQPRIVQTTFFLDRQIREFADERLGKQPAAGPCDVVTVTDADALETAARRIRFQHVPGQVCRPQLPRTSSSKPRHSRGPVLATFYADESNRLRARRYSVSARDQMDRLTRRAHPDFHLRTHRHPLDEAPEGRDEKRITLVATVVADLVAEKTSRDADAWSIAIARHTSLYVRRSRLNELIGTDNMNPAWQTSARSTSPPTSICRKWTMR